MSIISHAFHLSGSPITGECHPEFAHVGFSQLGHFIRRTDRKMEDLLTDFRAEGNEMTWALEALKNNQDSMKMRLQDVISVIFEKSNEDGFFIADSNSEESVTLVGALVCFFWKEEKMIDSRINKCREIFKVEPHEKPKEANSPAIDLEQLKDPSKSEEEQEMDVIDLKSSIEESGVGISSIRVPSMASGNLEAALCEIRESFSELICFKQRVDRRIGFLMMGFKENEGEKTVPVEAIKDWQENLKARLNELRENVFETANEDEILKIVMSTDEAAQILKSMLRSLMKEEQQIDALLDNCLTSRQVTASSNYSEHFPKAEGEKVMEIGEPDSRNDDLGSSSDGSIGSDFVVPDTGRSEEKMISVTVETKVGDEADQLSADDISLCDLSDLGESVDRKWDEFSYDNITGEDCKATDEKRNAQIQMENDQKSLQKYFAEGLKSRATKIQLEVSLAAVEVFLSLSTNKKESKFQAFKSCLEAINVEKKEAKVVKSVLEMLKVADKELRKLEMSSQQEETDRSSETDEDKHLQEAGERLEELLSQFIKLIAHLDALMNCMGQFESRVLADEAIHMFEKDMKDMEREVLAIESNMDVFRSIFSYGDFSPILDGIYNAYCGLDLQNA